MDYKNIKILAIDDNRDNLFTIKALIKETFPEASIEMATDGNEGLAMAYEQDPDVILLDILMPIIDGFEVCKQLKENDLSKDIPVIFITALKGDRDSKVKALEVGAEAFLAKPIDEIELIAQIRAMVKIKKNNIQKRTEKIELSLLVDEQTVQLKATNMAMLNLLEDLKAENEARKKSEEIQQLHSSRLEFAMYTANMAWWEMDILNGLVKFDNRKAEMLGYTPEKFNHYTDFTALLHPDDFEKCMNAMRNHLNGSVEKYEVDYRIKIKDGTYKWLLDIGTVNKRDAAGVPLYITGLVIDINDSKNAEDKIRQKDIEFQKLSKNMPDFIYQFTRRVDGTYHVPIATAGIKNVFGLNLEDVMNDFSPIAERIHPDDIANVFHKIENSANNLTAFLCEYRVQIPNKPIKWLLSKSTPEKLPDGSITWYGYVADITESKKVALKLLQLTQAIEQSPVSIFITDQKGNIEYVNQKFTKITGYDLEEIIGKNPRIIKSGNTSLKIYEQLWDSILDGKEWNGVLQNKKKNGEFFWESIKISSIKDKNGVITNFLAIKEDITERKIVDDKLKKIAWQQSHEVRGPLSSILGIISAMNFKITLEEKLELLGKLDEVSKKLDKAIHAIVNETIPSNI
ncbi:MAG: PAS domain-containing protein [Bacteroidetes bacterium]|nr:PAS domain-containing protein [Bacteroidota bacterium]